MPLRYQHSAETLGYEPAWVHDPDPAWYPNGIGDAVFAATWSMYAQGEAFLYVTGRYDSGYPRTWTILDPVTMKVTDAGGVRAYESNKVRLDSRDVIQVQRDPRGQLRGRSSLASYWSNVDIGLPSRSLCGRCVQLRWGDKAGPEFETPADRPARPASCKRNG